MRPAKSILDKTFVYVPSHLTSVTATWLRFGWRPKESADPQRLDLPNATGLLVTPERTPSDSEGKQSKLAVSAPRVIPIK